MDVYVLDNVTYRHRLKPWEYVSKALPSISNKVEDVHYISSDMDIQNPIHNYINNESFILYELQRILPQRIKNNIVFIVTEAKSPLIIYLKEYLDSLGITYNIIGFWTNDYKVKAGEGKQKHTLARQYMQVLMAMYDYNLVYSDKLHDELLQYGTTQIPLYKPKIITCTYPFDIVFNSFLQLHTEDVEKVDCILVDSENINRVYDIDIMRSQLTEYDIVSSMQYNMNESLFQRMLLRSKYLFVMDHSNLSSSIDVIIALILGTIPIIPNELLELIPEFEDITIQYDATALSLAPINWLYELENIKEKVNNYIRTSDIEEKINNIILTYFNSATLNTILWHL